MTDTVKPAPKAPAPARRGLYIAGAVVLAVLGAIVADTTVVRIGSDGDVRLQAFSADSFGETEFPRVQAFVAEKAVDAVTLAPEVLADKDAAIEKYGTPSSTGAIMMTKLTGVVGEGKSGLFSLAVDGVPSEVKIRVQTGPAVNGTDLRDAPGDIAFGDFTNQIEFQNAASGLNRAMTAAVLEDVDRASLTGKTVEVTGAFRLINPKNWMITPVNFTVQGE